MKQITFVYNNWRGETSERNVVPVRIEWGKIEYHKEEQWLLVGHDVDKNAERTFALRNIIKFGVEDPVINEYLENDMIRYLETKTDSGTMASAMLLGGILVKNDYSIMEMKLDEFSYGDSEPQSVEIIVRKRKPWYKRIFNLFKKNKINKVYTSTQVNYLAQS